MKITCSRKIFALLLAGTMAICGMPAIAAVPDNIPEPDQTFVNNSADMSFDLLRQIKADGGEENIVFSPISIQYMLGILNNAADAQTRQDINKTWKYPVKTSVSTINTELQNKMKRVERYYRGAEGTRFDIANAMYVKPCYPVNPTFEKTLEAYNAQIAQLDFTQPGAVDTVNQWASDHTNGRIPKIIDQFADAKNVRMVFLNAVNLEARWAGEFKEKNTAKNKFYGSGKTTNINMMKQGGISDGSYYEDPSAQFIRKQLDGGYDMFIVLPKSQKKGALDAVLKKLDSEYFQTMLKGSDSETLKYEGTLYLPRFQVDYSPEDLAESLKGMGIDLKKSSANFNQATVNPQYNLILSHIIHKATIDVNEEGVTASAVTMAEAEAEAAMETRTIKQFEMNVNRPFVYGVVDLEGSILFLGAVENLPDVK